MAALRADAVAMVGHGFKDAPPPQAVFATALAAKDRPGAALTVTPAAGLGHRSSARGHHREPRITGVNQSAGIRDPMRTLDHRDPGIHEPGEDGPASARRSPLDGFLRGDGEAVRAAVTRIQEAQRSQRVRRRCIGHVALSGAAPYQR